MKMTKETSGENYTNNNETLERNDQRLTQRKKKKCALRKNQGSFLRSWDSIRLTNKWNVGHPQYFSATSHSCVRAIPSPSPSSIRCLCPMCCPVPILYIYTLFCFKSLVPRPFINLYVWPKIGTRGNSDCDFAVCTILIIAVCNINDQWLDG